MTTRAVLFDFGGTLYDYATLAPGDLEALLGLLASAGITATPEEIRRHQRQAMRTVFHAYLPRRFYLHRDLFRDAAAALLASFGADPDPVLLDRYRERQWMLHQRDFALRDGVADTLRALRARGLHVGMVSNIDDDQLAHLIDVAGLRAHFDSLLSSEAAGACKPDPAIFTEALRRAACAPDEALFVGDTLAQDIAGANRMGLRSVLLWHREDKQPALDDVTPHHVIRRIPEILELLDQD